MEIGIVGSGDVGRALAAGLSGAGHGVRVGSREPDRADLLEWSQTAGIEVVDLTAAVRGAETVVVATAWDGTEDALGLAGPVHFEGTVVIDATNPLRFTDRLELAVGHTDSGGEHVQRWLPGARVVKAFNTVGYELMAHPALDGGPPTMFVAGDDAGAKDVVARLAGELGWGVHDCGPLSAARYTEAMAMIWIEHAMRSGTRRHAFKLLGDGSA